MDDITQKRLESERSHMAQELDHAMDAMGELKADAEAHTAELRKLGIPAGTDLRFANIFLGLAIGNMVARGLSREVCLEVFKAGCMLNETDPYDVCNNTVVGDRLEAIAGRIDDDSETLRLVFAWGRIFHAGFSESVIALEDELGESGATLGDIRAIAHKASRFMVETLYVAASQAV